MSKIREMLDANIPREVITTRTQSGKSLSYLEGWYVIDRLNQVLGTENWSWTINRFDLIPGDKISYICHGSLRVNIEGREAYKEGVGFGSDKTNFNAGEMAAKEAETDALKRAAMKLGRSLGLALYDKTQEYIDEQSNSAELSKRKEITTSSSKSEAITKNDIKTSGTQNSKTEPKVFKDQIKAAFAVLQAQKKITKEVFVKDYLSGLKTDDLNATEVDVVLLKIKTNFPELGL